MENILNFIFKRVPNFGFNKSLDFIVYAGRLLSFDRKFIAPGMYFSNNMFVLKVNLLLIFFFPVFLVMFMFFDSYLTIDYIFFFYTDEADFDDFIALIYMVLFFFIMLTDFDVQGYSEVNDVNDFSELAYNNSTNLNEVVPSYAHYLSILFWLNRVKVVVI